MKTIHSRLAGLLIIAAWPTPSAWAEFPRPVSSETSKPYPPVAITALRYVEPRPLRVWAVRIDLTAPDIDFAVTPRGKIDKFETVGQTTLDFAKTAGVQLAINATPFGPIPKREGVGVDVQGLDLSEGDMVSAPSDRYGALLIDEKGHAALLAPPIRAEQVKGFRHGVGGFTMVLAKGRNLYSSERDNAKAALHPRSAVGLTADHKTMVWLVVDGRQKAKSEGVSLYELAELARSLDCDDVLNLDGGGSTTLVLQEPAARTWKVVNSPSGGALRFNGNNLGLRVFLPGRDLTAAQLRAIMPNMPPERVRAFLGPLNKVMERYQINTPRRRAAFLAQLAHESGEFRSMEEIASGEAYEGRKDLGNTQPGDGKRFKGRGPIQLTGRSNYRKAGAALGLDLENTPELAERPTVGCLVAGWYWDTHKLNEPADLKDFRTITRRINGGLRGLENRERYYQKALEVLKD